MARLFDNRMISTVEQHVLNETKEKLRHSSDEQIDTIVVENFSDLGRLSALRFIEWVQSHPEGVVSLPTGKTPEFFIKELKRFLLHWHKPEVQFELEQGGIESRAEPDLRGLQFVQIDEFFPIRGEQQNSFYFYVNKYYIENFGLDKDRALLIHCNEILLPQGLSLDELTRSGGLDLSLRYRSPLNSQEELERKAIFAVDQWCVEYEDRIRERGGIEFFMGGIGPDGHIGFNVRGSDMHSTTRLTPMNYETQAAAATDLGGMEVARRSLVITIGLGTIAYNKDCVALIVAAGETKADIIANSIAAARDVRFPASGLQTLSQARFYITRGAAKAIESRAAIRFREADVVTDVYLEEIVVGVAIAAGIKILDLSREDYQRTSPGLILLERSTLSLQETNRRVHAGLVHKIETGMRVASNKRFLHTEPHDDDIMLGYLPFVVRHLREHSNTHAFAAFTSGFTSVTNQFMLELCQLLKSALEAGRLDVPVLMHQKYFDASFESQDVWRYLEGVAARSSSIQEDGVLRRFVRNIIDCFHVANVDRILSRLEALIEYFVNRYPGEKDDAQIQELKGMRREWESECLWGYFGIGNDSIEHLRLGFYQGNRFSEEPTVIRDVQPVVALLERVRPDIVTVALDPEASGPDTHYKVLQAITEAIKRYDREDVVILGYRNVWHRFETQEANVFVPVSLNTMTLQYEAFMNSYASQKTASFPSHEFDGPFPLLAQKIQGRQYEVLKICLGAEFFYNHTSALIRATRGFVFLKEMTRAEFYSHSSELKRKTEPLH